MRLRVLGRLELLDGEQAPVIGDRPRRILAALSVRPNATVTLEALLDAVWGDRPPPTAVRSLRTHVSRLRRTLGPSGPSIDTTSGGYRLRATDDELDALTATEFAAVARAAARDERHREAVSAYDAALACWAGPSFDGFAEEAWARPEAVRLDELRMVLEEERVDALLALGQHTALVGELARSCTNAPLRERRWAQQMLALYRCGRQAEALRAYQSLREQLIDELGIEPSPDLADLERRILAQDPELGVATTTHSAPIGDEIRVFLVDDHPVWRDGVRRSLEATGGFTVVGEADDAESAMRTLDGNAVDVVLLDLYLPGVGGVAAAAEITKTCPAVRVLMLSSSEDDADVLDALAAGAHGYVLKTGTSADLVDAVRRVYAGEPVFSPELAGLVLGQLRARRRADGGAAGRVLYLLARGRSASEAAVELEMSESDVRAAVRVALDSVRQQPARGTP